MPEPVMLAISDARFESLMLVVIALIAAIPTTLAAIWSRSAKQSSAEAAKEVMTNGGMDDPNPNVNDHIKYQTRMLESLLERQDATEHLLANHISHSRVMDAALAQVYLAVRPGMKLPLFFDENWTEEKD